MMVMLLILAINMVLTMFMVIKFMALYIAILSINYLELLNKKERFAKVSIKQN